MTDWTADQQKEHRKLWIEALRSGEYEQTHGKLKLGNSFCCLGVACDLYAKQFPEAVWHDNKFMPNKHQYMTYSGFSLPNVVMDWLGLAASNGLYANPKKDTWGLIDDNDDDKKSFLEIADIIESEPEGLIADN
jgi:hypothetical protein